MHREDLSSKSVEPSRQRDNHEGIEVTRSLVNQWDCEEPINSTGSEEGEALSRVWGTYIWHASRGQRLMFKQLNSKMNVLSKED